MVDNLNRVIAVQELEESPKSGWAHGSTNGAFIYNFVKGRSRLSKTYRVDYSRSSSAGSVHLTSTLYDEDRKPRENARLHIPKHIAGIFLYCSEVIKD